MFVTTKDQWNKNDKATHESRRRDHADSLETERSYHQGCTHG